MTIPKFIVLEGLDGSGKSTVARFIQEYITNKGFEFIQTREPGGTKLAEDIRALLFCEDEPVSDDTELLLMYASRLQHVNIVIKPAIENNKIVICDRFSWSSIAYQGGGRELGVNKVKNLDNLFLRDIKPDLTIYLDVEPDIGLQRAKKLSGTLDRIEKSGLVFFAKTRATYIELVASDNNAHTINTMQELDKVTQDIKKVLDIYFTDPTVKLQDEMF